MTSPLSGRNEAADNNNDDVPSPESMALGELKKELIDLGDSSFVFNDQTELIIALKAARRANGGGVNVVKSSTSSSSGGGGHSMNSSTKSSKNSVAAMPSRMKAVPEIPTMKEDDDLASSSGYGNAQNKSGVGGLLRKTRRVGRRNSLKSSLKTNNKRIHTNHQMVMEQKDESVRLVEYFVMVSSRERKPDPEDDTASSSQQPPQQRRRGPPDPTTDKLDPRTLSRFDARRAHLQGHDCHADNDAAVHLSSIANYSSMSTSSTCSSEDCDMSGRSGHSGSGDGGGGAMSGIRPSVNTSNLTGLSSSSENDEVEEYLLEPIITARYPAEGKALLFICVVCECFVQYMKCPVLYYLP